MTVSETQTALTFESPRCSRPTHPSPLPAGPDPHNLPRAWPSGPSAPPTEAMRPLKRPPTKGRSARGRRRGRETRNVRSHPPPQTNGRGRAPLGGCRTLGRARRAGGSRQRPFAERTGRTRIAGGGTPRPGAGWLGPGRIWMGRKMDAGGRLGRGEGS